MAETHYELKAAIAAALNAEAIKMWQYYTKLQSCEPYLSSISVASVTNGSLNQVSEATLPTHTASDASTSEADVPTSSTMHCEAKVEEKGIDAYVDVVTKYQLNVSNKHFANESVDTAETLEAHPVSGCVRTFEHAVREPGTDVPPEAVQGELAGDVGGRCQDDDHLAMHVQPSLAAKSDLSSMEQAIETTALHCHKTDELSCHPVAHKATSEKDQSLLQHVTVESDDNPMSSKLLSTLVPLELDLCVESTGAIEPEGTFHQTHAHAGQSCDDSLISAGCLAAVANIEIKCEGLEPEVQEKLHIMKVELEGRKEMEEGTGKGEEELGTEMDQEGWEKVGSEEWEELGAEKGEPEEWEELAAEKGESDNIMAKIESVTNVVLGSLPDGLTIPNGNQNTSVEHGVEDKGPALVEEQPATEKVEEQPATEKVEEQPVTEKVEEQPVTEKIEEQPATEKVKEQPATEKVEEQPFTEKIEAQPATEKVEEQPVTEKIEEQPATEKVEEQPAAEKIEEQPATEKIEQQPVTEKVEEQPVAEKVEEQPATQKIEQQPVTEKVEEQPATDKTDQLPLIEKVEEQPATEKIEQQPVTEKVEEQPVTEKVEEQPATQKIEQQPVTEKLEEQPATEKTDQLPLIEKVEQQPVTEKVGEQPVTEKIEEQPATEKVKEQPVTEKIEEQPATAKVEEQPVTEKVEEQPVTEKVEEQPATEKIEEQPATQKTDQPPLIEKVEEQPVTEKIEEQPATEKIEEHPATEKAEQQPTIERTEAVAERAEEQHVTVAQNAEESIPLFCDTTELSEGEPLDEATVPTDRGDRGAAEAIVLSEGHEDATEQEPSLQFCIPLLPGFGTPEDFQSTPGPGQDLQSHASSPWSSDGDGDGDGGSGDGGDGNDDGDNDDGGGGGGGDAEDKSRQSVQNQLMSDCAFQTTNVIVELQRSQLLMLTPGGEDASAEAPVEGRISTLEGNGILTETSGQEGQEDCIESSSPSYLVNTWKKTDLQTQCQCVPAIDLRVELGLEGHQVKEVVPVNLSKGLWPEKGSKEADKGVPLGEGSSQDDREDDDDDDDTNPSGNGLQGTESQEYGQRTKFAHESEEEESLHGSESIDVLESQEEDTKAEMHRSELLLTDVPGANGSCMSSSRDLPDCVTVVKEVFLQRDNPSGMGSNDGSHEAPDALDSPPPPSPTFQAGSHTVPKEPILFPTLSSTQLVPILCGSVAPFTCAAGKLTSSMVHDTASATEPIENAEVSTGMDPVCYAEVSTGMDPVCCTETSVGTEWVHTMEICVGTEKVETKDCASNTNFALYDLKERIKDAERFQTLKELNEKLTKEMNEEKSQRMVADHLAKIVQSDLSLLRQKAVYESTTRLRLENELGELKAELGHTRKQVVEKDERIKELEESLEGTMILVKKLEEQNAVSLISKGGIDYMLQAKLAEGRAMEAEQKMKVLQAEVLQYQNEVRQLLDRVGEATRERSEMVSNRVHTQLLQIADEKAMAAEKRAQELEREVQILNRRLTLLEDQKSSKSTAGGLSYPLLSTVSASSTYNPYSSSSNPYSMSTDPYSSSSRPYSTSTSPYSSSPYHDPYFTSMFSSSPLTLFSNDPTLSGSQTTRLPGSKPSGTDYTDITDNTLHAPPPHSSNMHATTDVSPSKKPPIPSTPKPSVSLKPPASTKPAPPAKPTVHSKPAVSVKPGVSIKPAVPGAKPSLSVKPAVPIKQVTSSTGKPLAGAKPTVMVAMKPVPTPVNPAPILAGSILPQPEEHSTELVLPVFDTTSATPSVPMAMKKEKAQASSDSDWSSDEESSQHPLRLPNASTAKPAVGFPPPAIAPKPKLNRKSNEASVAEELPSSFADPTRGSTLHLFKRTKGPSGRRLPSELLSSVSHFYG